MLRLRGQGQLLWRLLPLVQVGFLLLGRKWNYFYGWMLDRQERRNTIEVLLARAQKRRAAGKDLGLYDLSRGEYHANYLRRHGLLQSHTILDIGCGFGRTGIPLIRWLDPSRYIGAEISAERLRIAKEWTKLERLDEQRPRWILSYDNTLPYLVDEELDFIWAQSVLTHMPEAEVRVLLPAAYRALKPGGRFLFNFTISGGDEKARSSIKDYQYPIDDMKALCQSAGFELAELDDWQDDLEDESRAKHRHNMMLLLTKPSAAVEGS